MARSFVYSFEDTVVEINHPNFENFSAYGTGLGSISVSYAGDVTSQDVAADLSVVISKFARKNGTVAFTVTQASNFNNYLMRLTNFLENANVSEFALATISITNKSTGDKYFCSGVSHQKKADNNFGSSAENRTWTFMCGNIDQQ